MARPKHTSKTEVSSATFETHLNRFTRCLRGNGDFPQPTDFTDGDLFAESYLKYNLKRKSLHFSGEVMTKDERRAVTISKFLERETRNKEINESFLFGYTNGAFKAASEGDHLLALARRFVYQIVGIRPNYAAIVNAAGFGNGASAVLKRVESQRSFKYDKGLTVTPRALNIAHGVVKSSPVWVKHLNSEVFIDGSVLRVCSDGSFPLCPKVIKVIGGSILDTVPKDMSVDRIIMKEPELNGYLQKGVGSVMRNLLKRNRPGLPGVNLNSSGSVNSEMAKTGSIDGSLATVDARAASDSLTIALYEFLFPPKWFDMLMKLRSPNVLIDGKWHKLQMMSGMGNGFTFEAESIIFYALGQAAALFSQRANAKEEVSIHGDDLIIPADCYSFLASAYAAAGVEINEEKSYADGPFRESCGGNFFKGETVTPVYVKDQTGRKLGDHFWLYNSMLLWYNDRSLEWRYSPRGERFRQVLRSVRATTVPKPALWLVPWNMSRRSGFFSDAPKGSWKKKLLSFRPKKKQFDQGGAYLEWLNSPLVSPSVDKLLAVSNERPTRKYEVADEGREVESWKRHRFWANYSDTYAGESLCLLCECVDEV